MQLFTCGGSNLCWARKGIIPLAFFFFFFLLEHFLYYENTIVLKQIGIKNSVYVHIVYLGL